jgi:ABC-type branched-subunit amino acid transport system ATPase component
MSVSDRVVVLDQGRELATGTPEEIGSNAAVLAAYLGESIEEGDEQKTTAGKNGAPKTAAKPPEPLLQADSLSGGYGDIEVFRDISLVARPGEIVTLLGPNGAGKTTLLLTLAGDLKPLGGSVEVLGKTLPARLHDLAESGLGLVPDDRGVISGLSCHDNLRLGPGDVDLALELFPELGLLDRRAGLLSGGEQQMLALGRALSARPKILLIDELSHGLAPLVVERLLRAVRAAADSGTSVVLVEQHAGQALRFADHGLVLRHGHVELSGTASELKARIDEIEHAYVAAGTPAITASASSRRDE